MSKLKQNPYARFYMMQLEIIEQQRRHWLKHPDEFIKDVTRMIFTMNKNISIEDRMKLEKSLLEG
jgi:hypothetical protein